MRIKLLVYLLLELTDILSGVVKTLIRQERFSSSKMAVGLYKKMGNLLCLFASYVLSKYMYDVIQLSLFDFVWLYTIALTTVSIFENVGQPKLIEKVKEVFKGEIE